jgi:thioredoxin reductase (NADPH)
VRRRVLFRLVANLFSPTIRHGVRGLSVLVLDCRSSGGQAGASARIENYLGFPTGISGMALMARAYNQAHKFGVETTIPSETVCCFY